MSVRRPRRRMDDLFGWLDLVETDGPFLSRPTLKAAFPQGLARPDDAVDGVRGAFRVGYTDWERAWTSWVRAENRAEHGPSSRYPAARDLWVRTMLTEVLEWGEYARWDDGARLQASNLDQSVTVSSTAVLEVPGSRAALLLVVDPTQDLAAAGGDGWAASPIDRGAALLRSSAEAGSRVPVAVVTDGRWWALVWQSAQGSVGSGVFDGALFREEPDLRDAFWALARLTSLAGGAADRRLPALLEASVASAEEITDALGSQVRASVELLVQSFSASHLHALAGGSQSPLPADGHEVYDAAVTSMMRIVFLLFAEANELLPTEQLYREAYAISDVLERLDERRRHAVGVEGDEALGATYDTWHRLLATSRALYEGATFEDLRMPAYGGSLFDPARFTWLTAVDDATGSLRVLVDDRVMFHVLRSVQHAQVGGEDRQVSFRELDVEQIGYVYEGLLGYSARYTDTVTVGLQGPEAGSEAEIPLEVLHDLSDDADDDPAEFASRLSAWVKEHQPGAKMRTTRQLAKAYDESGTSPVQDEARRRLRPVLGDDKLVEELAGYYGLMRLDPRGLPYVVLAGGLVVMETRSRATSGTHYTPRSLAEEVVHHALEPLVYSPGPLQTADTTRWRLVSSSQILDLKVADIAAGSGAFLVAAARYLGARLLEAWDAEGITGDDSAPESRRRREVEARREVIAHCLYGADINPMAVEMCKLSLWLVSLDPDRPFSFVDDKIFCGNSLLGLTELRQLRGLHIDPSPARLRNPGFTVDVDLAIQRATEVRHQLASPVSESDAMRSTRAKRQLMKQLDDNLAQLRTMADGIIAAGLSLGGKTGRGLDEAYENLSYALMKAELGDRRMLDGIVDRGLTPTVETDYANWKPLHWVLEVPDVMIEHGGFDAVVGNPPYLGGPKVSRAIGENLRQWCTRWVSDRGGVNLDVVAFFIARMGALLKRDGLVGVVCTNAVNKGATRNVGLDFLSRKDFTFIRASTDRPWPGSAAVLFTAFWAVNSPSAVPGAVLNGLSVPGVDSGLAVQHRLGSPLVLRANLGLCYIGVSHLGKGFILDPAEARRLLQESPANSQVVKPFLSGEDLNRSALAQATRWAINFEEMTYEEAARFAGPMAIVRERVKPERQTKDAKRYPRMVHEWWKFWNSRPSLTRRLSEVEDVIALTIHSKIPTAHMVPSAQIFSNGLIVWPSSDTGLLAVLASSVHVEWAIARSSTLGTTIRYTPSDAFSTFPIPVDKGTLRDIGHDLMEARNSAMSELDLGLTKLYNLVNSPSVPDEGHVARLRELQVALDRAVVTAYGWDGLSLGHGFYPYQEESRFTVSPAARALLQDLVLEENHRRARLEGVAQLGGAAVEFVDVDSEDS